MPTIYIISGCNGSGKTTAASTLIPDILELAEFVNADAIAAGLSPFNPDGVAFLAGRLMLERVHELARQKSDFVFETTLSTKSYFPFLVEQRKRDYRIVLLYLYLDDPSLALKRIAERVRQGGHSVPHDVIIRRYERGRKNLFHLYMPISDHWIVYDNSQDEAELIASGGCDRQTIVQNADTWKRIKL